MAVVEPTGAETMACLRAAVEIVAVFRERRGLAPGQMVRLRACADKAHLFDSERRARL